MSGPETVDSISDQAAPILRAVTSGSPITVAQSVAVQARDYSYLFGIGMRAYVENAQQLLTAQWAKAAATTAPVWRLITIAGPRYAVSAWGTSAAASTSALGALWILGPTAVVAAGTWVMLGLGYYEARQWVKPRGVMIGFSHGFVMGVLQWNWHNAVTHFGVRRLVITNTWDPQMDLNEAIGNNEGLKAGFALGSSLPADVKKNYRVLLRKFAGRHDSAPWSKN